MKINHQQVQLDNHGQNIITLSGFRKFYEYQDGLIYFLQDPDDKTESRFLISAFYDLEDFHRDPGGMYLGSIKSNGHRQHLFVRAV